MSTNKKLASLKKMESKNSSPSNVATVRGFHRTRNRYSPESIAYNGFDKKIKRVDGNKPMYGPGFYMTRNLVDHLRPAYDDIYGSVIIQNEVYMHDVLILDLALSIKVFGKPKTVIQQFIDRDMFDRLSQPEKALLEDHSKKCALAFKTKYFTADSAKVFWNTGLVNIENWNGLAYTGRQDGACMVIYNVNQVYPRNWAEYDRVVLKKQFLAKNTAINDDDDDDDDDNNDDDDDDDDDSNHPSPTSPLQNFIIENLPWTKLNPREVEGIRNGKDSRFCRWLKKFQALPLKKATHRFGLCLGMLKENYSRLFINDCIAFAKKSPENKLFIKKMFDGLSVTAIVNWQKQYGANFELIKFEDGIFKQYPNPSKFWEMLASVEFLHDRHRQFAKVEYDYIEASFIKVFALHHDRIKNLRGKPLFDALNDMCKDRLYANKIVSLKQHPVPYFKRNYARGKNSNTYMYYSSQQIREITDYTDKRITGINNIVRNSIVKKLSLPGVISNIELVGVIVSVLSVFDFPKYGRPKTVEQKPVKTIKVSMNPDSEPDIEETIKTNKTLNELLRKIENEKSTIAKVNTFNKVKTKVPLKKG